MKTIKMVGFWESDLRALVEHLEKTGYSNTTELIRLKALLEAV